MSQHTVIDATVAGLGYELVEGRMVRPHDATDRFQPSRIREVRRVDFSPPARTGAR